MANEEFAKTAPEHLIVYEKAYQNAKAAQVIADSNVKTRLIAVNVV